MDKKNNKVTMILGVIVIILILVIVMLLLDKNKDSEKLPEEDKKYTEEVVLEENEDVKKLYGMIPRGFQDDGINIYQERIIRIDDLSVEDLAFGVHEELINNYHSEVIASVSEFEGEPNEDDYDEFEDYEKAYMKKCRELGHIIESNLTCYVKGSEPNGWDAYEAETIEKIYKKFYGENFTYKNPKYIGGTSAGCHYYNGYYLCEEGGGYGPGGISNHTQFQKLVKTDTDAYIYEKYLHVLEVCDEQDDTCYEEIFTDYNKENKIGREDESSHSYDLFEKYGDKALTYKHTYKKNSDGSYYWYSVELVK